MLMKTSLLLGLRYSSLSMRAIDLRAPSCLAIAAERMLVFSSGPTAIKRSHRCTSPRVRVSNEVTSPSIVSTSDSEASSSSRFSSSSMIVMSWYSLLSIFTRWLPTSPAPAISIFMINKR